MKMLTYQQFLRRQRDELKALLKEADEQLALLSKGEQCDHAVGICWCDLFRLREKIREVLK